VEQRGIQWPYPVLARLNALPEFYPRHIEKQDKHFFLPVMRYFADEEKHAMLQEGNEVDGTMIHEKYRQIRGGRVRLRQHRRS
jgi:hypothetical protein